MLHAIMSLIGLYFFIISTISGTKFWLRKTQIRFKDTLEYALLSWVFIGLVGGILTYLKFSSLYTGYSGKFGIIGGIIILGPLIILAAFLLGFIFMLLVSIKNKIGTKFKDLPYE